MDVTKPDLFSDFRSVGIFRQKYTGYNRPKKTVFSWGLWIFIYKKQFFGILLTQFF
jgi:hypothetical protein